MATVSATTPILAQILAQMQAGGYTAQQTGDLITYINDSPLLASQLIQLQGNGWNIQIIPEGASTTVNSTTISISIPAPNASTNDYSISSGFWWVGRSRFLLS